jgi:prevent-host-death family protein
MKKIAVSTLRENLSVYLKKVQNGQTITITTRGREMAILVPVKNKRKQSTKILQDLGKSAVIGDIVSPIEEDWEVMK